MANVSRGTGFDRASSDVLYVDGKHLKRAVLRRYHGAWVFNPSLLPVLQLFCIAGSVVPSGNTFVTVTPSGVVCGLGLRHTWRGEEMFVLSLSGL